MANFTYGFDSMLHLEEFPEEDSGISLRECLDCGQYNELPATEPGMSLYCMRCNRLFRHTRYHSLEKTFCFAIACLIFYLVLISSPLLDVSLYGRFRSSMLRSGAFVFEGGPFWLLGVIVLVTTLAMPFLRLALLITVLIGLRLPRPPHILVDCFRWANEVARWAMLEVFMLGLLVAYTRLQALAYVQIDIAVYALVGVILASSMMDAMLDVDAVWEALERRGLASRHASPETAQGATAISCEVCGLLNHAPVATPCRRCDGVLHVRKPGSIRRAWAFAIGAMIFYIPANCYSVMTITKLGKTTDHTIIGGMMEFVQLGMWPLALLIFTASVAIPVLKILALCYMLVKTQTGSSERLMLRTRVYRIIDFIGRWSMVDVFMVSILAGLMRFGQFADVRAGIGACCFATVVVLTILAVESFDVRLMWDASEPDDRLPSLPHEVTPP